MIHFISFHHFRSWKRFHDNLGAHGLRWCRTSGSPVPPSGAGKSRGHGARPQPLHSQTSVHRASMDRQKQLPFLFVDPEDARLNCKWERTCRNLLAGSYGKYSELGALLKEIMEEPTTAQENATWFSETGVLRAWYDILFILIINTFLFMKNIEKYMKISTSESILIQ